MEEIKLYTFTPTIPYSGGMALVAARSVEEAKGFLGKELIDWYEFDNPQEVPDCKYTGKPGLIRYNAHEG